MDKIDIALAKCKEELVSLKKELGWGHTECSWAEKEGREQMLGYVIEWTTNKVKYHG